MTIISGREIADKILNKLKGEIETSEKKPKLAVLLVGNNSASEVYVDLKKKAAERVGIDFELIRFNENNLEEEIVQKIQELNQDEKVNGIIVQLPLPEKFATQKIINAIDPKKDVDGFHPDNITLPAVFPQAMLELLKSTSEYVGKKAVVVANSETFGEKMCEVLKKEKIESQYVLAGDITEEKLNQADILISAIGQAGIIKYEMVKDGAIIIDGGINKIGEKVFGDVDFENVKDKTSFITPVPGGVGPMTIACLLRNVFLASKIV
jgi:methylenetetrahydrofolate dehydrogenase (NADP+)/methenyltetrahydrofolate cyclohydrolase